MAYTTPPRFTHVLTYNLSLRQRPRCSKRRRISMVRSSRSLTWPRSLSHTLCLSLLLAHSLTFCISYSLTHSTWSRSLAHTLCLPHTLCLALSLSRSLPPSLTHSHPPPSQLTQSLTHSPTHSLHAPFLSPSLPLSPPHTAQHEAALTKKRLDLNPHFKAAEELRQMEEEVANGDSLMAAKSKEVLYRCACAYTHTHSHTHTHTV